MTIAEGSPLTDQAFKLYGDRVMNTQGRNVILELMLSCPNRRRCSSRTTWLMTLRRLPASKARVWTGSSSTRYEQRSNRVRADDDFTSRG